MPQDLETLLQNASKFTKESYNIDIHRSQLKPYSDEDWKRFCEMNGFDRDASGLYVPESHSAYVNVESPFLASNIMHELYGHGLFCEHSIIGHNLVEKSKSKESDAYLNAEKERSEGIFSTRLADYEGFAVWMERTLDEAIGMRPLWNKKKDSMPEYYAQLDDMMRQVEQKVTWLGIFGSLSMPKYYGRNDALELLSSVHEPSRIHFALLYGSQKPHSDIDFMTISEKGDRNIYNDWIDIGDFSLEEFEYRIRMFDVPVSEALFSGEVILGNDSLAERYRKKLQEQPISDEAVRYNERKAKEQAEISEKLTNERMKKQAESFAETYQMNAELLSKGKRPLTRKNIYDFYKT